MKEAYVSFEVAKLLKEKGFDWEVNGYFCSDVDNPSRIEWSTKDYNSHKFHVSAPTQQMACRWLIETHNIHIEPHFLRASGDYVYNIIHSPLELDDIHSFSTVFNTKEDAVEAALQYCLTNLI